MMRDGDEATGFSITVDAGEVRVVGWGFWDSSLCLRFGEAVRREIGALVRPVGLRVDVRELKPMREEGQRVWSETFALVAGRGITAATLSEPPPLTKLQFIRLCRGAGITIQYV